MTLSANASDTDGTIVDVEFYAGSTRIGSDSSQSVLGDVEQCPEWYAYPDGSRP